MSSSENPKIFLRHDQLLKDIDDQRYQDAGTTIFAPDWVKIGLEKLSKFIPEGSVFEVYDQHNRMTKLTISSQLTLKELIAIARNELINLSGEINFTNYWPLIVDRSIIYAIKDLARQCIIVTYDQATHYGGFKSRRVEQDIDNKVMVVDLPALQFRKHYNSGRLVLVSDQETPGLLDQLIFEKVVGEQKKSLEKCRQDKTRYLNHNNVLLDSLAYKKFVANDFLLVCVAVNRMADGAVNLKFLKYGTGISGGPFAKTLDSLIIEGIIDGLCEFINYQKATNEELKIRAFEFPFFKPDRRLTKICKVNNFKCQFGESDALKKTKKGMTTATTNCSDPHVVAGNQMLSKSVDATIAENLASRGCKLSPLINQLMGEEFVQLTINKPVNGSHRPGFLPNISVWRQKIDNLFFQLRISDKFIDGNNNSNGNKDEAAQVRLPEPDPDVRKLIESFIEAQEMKNQKSEVLDEEENQIIFELLGDNCTSLVTAVIQLLTRNANSPIRNWSASCTGVACLVMQRHEENNNKKKVFLKVFDFERRQLSWQFELPDQFRYRSWSAHLHVFETDKCTAGLFFANQQEAVNFIEAINKISKTAPKVPESETTPEYAQVKKPPPRRKKKSNLAPAPPSKSDDYLRIKITMPPENYHTQRPSREAIRKLHETVNGQRNRVSAPPLTLTKSAPLTPTRPAPPPPTPTTPSPTALVPPPPPPPPLPSLNEQLEEAKILIRKKKVEDVTLRRPTSLNVQSNMSSVFEEITNKKFKLKSLDPAKVEEERIRAKSMSFLTSTGDPMLALRARLKEIARVKNNDSDEER